MRISHRQSHSALIRDVAAVGVAPIRGRLDAIVVPAVRPSPAEAITLSAALSVPLVVLCSGQARPDRIAERVAGTVGARALIVDVPEGYQVPDFLQLTSAAVFRPAAAGRTSDLSVKRNLGLLLGRLRGWTKILFVDDDISRLRPHDVRRLAAGLDRHPVASLVSRHFPDNSVVCHARRLAGLDQDVFLSGATLGVDLRHPDLSFFPDIYSEDWFFFARHAAERTMPKIGEVRQAEYLPFADPRRAEQEEFGDLLAEGLYALFENSPGSDFGEYLAAATHERLWRQLREGRLAMIGETMDALSRSEADHPTALQAQESLRFAEKQALSISPHLCAAFVESWLADQLGWQQLLRRTATGLGERDALAELGLSTWISSGH